MPEIYLYAEVLPHVRLLTLHASLETLKNEHTRVLLSSDKKVITALHDGDASSIYLPTQISGTAEVTFPLDKRTEISTRLEIEDLESLMQTSNDSDHIDVPWPAGDLGEQVALHCQDCDACLVEHGRISTWKDLPSENWSELMDAWFCHKPHTNEDEKLQDDSAKSFAGMGSISPEPGMGLVDTMSLFLLAQDFKSTVTVTKEDGGSLPTLSCASCNAILGKHNDTDNTNRIYKSTISVRSMPESAPESFASTLFVCAQLLALIATTASRKVVVHQDEDPNSSETKPGLLLWIFNPNVYYSSSKKGAGAQAYRAMKIFYKTLPDPLKALEENSNSMEELVLLHRDFSELLDTMKASTLILPQSARTFQDWEVGLLDRYEKVPTGKGVLDQNPLTRKAGDMSTLMMPEGMQELYL